MLSKKIKYTLIVCGIVVLSILLLAYCLAIATYGSGNNSPYSMGGFTCGDNWHGTTSDCSFSKSYKESLGNICLVVFVVILLPLLAIKTHPLIVLTILVIIILLYKYKRRKKLKTTTKLYDE